MGLVPISTIAGNVISLAKTNTASFSTGAVIIGMISAVILAIKAGKEASEDIEEVKEEFETDELSFGEIVRVTWKRFLPVILILALTISCLVYSTNKMMKRYAALAAQKEMVLLCGFDMHMLNRFLAAVKKGKLQNVELLTQERVIGCFMILLLQDIFVHQWKLSKMRKKS